MPGRQVSAAFDGNLAASLRYTAPVSRSAAWWERLRLRLEWRLRFPALVTAGSLAAAAMAAVVTPGLIRQHQAREERGRYVQSVLERHQQLEQSGALEWDAVDASIAVSTGSVITE
jgi:hypothetical protein